MSGTCSRHTRLTTPPKSTLPMSRSCSRKISVTLPGMPRHMKVALRDEPKRQPTTITLYPAFSLTTTGDPLAAHPTAALLQYHLQAVLPPGTGFAVLYEPAAQARVSVQHLLALRARKKRLPITSFPGLPCLSRTL